MSEHITGTQMTLGEIFGDSREYIIPIFQRPYAWEEEQIESLFDDLYEFYKSNQTNNRKEDYFLGSIVLIKSDRDHSFEVIDGQQRLTSLAILFSVITDSLSGDDKKDVKKCIFQEARRSLKIPERSRIVLRKSDQEFFKKYIIDNNDLSNLFEQDISKFKTESQKLIYQMR